MNKQIKKLQKEINKAYKHIDSFVNESLKGLNGLKVNCVFDRQRVGFLGSYDRTEEHEGRFLFNDVRGCLFFLPKRHTKTGQLITGRFFYKILNQKMKGGIN